MTRLSAAKSGGTVPAEKRDSNARPLAGCRTAGAAGQRQLQQEAQVGILCGNGTWHATGVDEEAAGDHEERKNQRADDGGALVVGHHLMNKWDWAP